MSQIQDTLEQQLLAHFKRKISQSKLDFLIPPSYAVFQVWLVFWMGIIIDIPYLLYKDLACPNTQLMEIYIKCDNIYINKPVAQAAGADPSR